MFIPFDDFEELKEAEIKLKAIRRYCLESDTPDVNDILLIIGSRKRPPITDETTFSITPEGEQALQFMEIN